MLLLGCTAADGDIHGYSQINSEHMLKVGLSDIQQIYIAEPLVSDLAFAGLSGLQRIEPDMAIERQDGTLRIRLRDNVAGVTNLPPPNDASGWATTVSKLLDEGRKVSPKLGKARTEELYTAVFESVARKLDPYSRYAGADEARNNRASRDGFGGIGVTIVPHDEGAEITEIASGLPADMAGLRQGDRIVSIDGRNVAKIDLQSIAQLLQGPVGRQVYLHIQRKTEVPPVHVSIRRTHITPQTVFYQLDDGIAVIELTSFNAETAAAVAESVFRARNAKGSKLRGIIIDLRDNPGGLLHQAVRIADLFIEKGRIISTSGRHRDSMQLFDATPGDIAKGLPMAVLLNGSSASAAEILAAALQDHGRAVLVGSTSYGKGTVQTVLRMPNEGELVLTWARLHAPSGYSMNGLGVVPTICTVNGQDADRIVQSALTKNGTVWRRMLALRRGFDTATDPDRKLLRSYCPSTPNGQGALDLKVAKLLLAVQKQYMQTVQLVRTANGL